MLYSAYTKKEDVRDVPKNQRVMFGIVLFAMGAVLSVMIFYVLPQLLVLFEAAEIQKPWQIENSKILGMLVLAGYVVAAVYYLFSKPDYSHVDRVAKKYKKGEMIKSRELMNKPYQFMIVLSLIPAVLYIFTVLIMPIYSITESL